MPMLVERIENQGMVKKFKLIFDSRIENFCDTVSTMAFNKFKFDIIKFDEYLHKQFKYSEEKHGSLRLFIKTRFGNDMFEFLFNLV